MSSISSKSIPRRTTGGLRPVASEYHSNTNRQRENRSASLGARGDCVRKRTKRHQTKKAVTLTAIGIPFSDDPLWSRAVPTHAGYSYTLKPDERIKEDASASETVEQSDEVAPDSDLDENTDEDAPASETVQRSDQDELHSDSDDGMNEGDLDSEPDPINTNWLRTGEPNPYACAKETYGLNPSSPATARSVAVTPNGGYMLSSPSATDSETYSPACAYTPRSGAYSPYTEYTAISSPETAGAQSIPNPGDDFVSNSYLQSEQDAEWDAQEPRVSQPVLGNEILQVPTREQFLALTDTPEAREQMQLPQMIPGFNNLDAYEEFVRELERSRHYERLRQIRGQFQQLRISQGQGGNAQVPNELMSMTAPVPAQLPGMPEDTGYPLENWYIGAPAL
ncbi:hypothetical protein EDC01DRAFT_732890 [Geopyxis carbonaria]|nr:hypothetical protein EDC01DRAFT_732890 [Geopyxis carbonaria]